MIFQIKNKITGAIQNNQVSAITGEWIREFMDKEGIKYPTYEIMAINK
jgi:hypothetical protein